MLRMNRKMTNPALRNTKKLYAIFEHAIRAYK